MISDKSILQDLWDITKSHKVHIIGVPDWEKKKKNVESLFKEIMAENFPNLGRFYSQVHEANRLL